MFIYIYTIYTHTYRYVKEYANLFQRNTLPVFVFVEEFPTCRCQLTECLYGAMRRISEKPVCMCDSDNSHCRYLW